MKLKMKPFDIDKAIAGEPVFTRSGKNATYVGKIKDLVHHPYVFYVDGLLLSYNVEGTVPVRMASYDLFMEVEQTYKVGDVLLVNSGTFSCRVVICQTGPETIQLIGLDSGNRFADKTTVINHLEGIKDSDIEKLFDEEYTYELDSKGAFQHES